MRLGHTVNGWILGSIEVQRNPGVNPEILEGRKMKVMFRRNIDYWSLIVGTLNTGWEVMLYKILFRPQMDYYTSPHYE